MTSFHTFFQRLVVILSISECMTALESSGVSQSGLTLSSLPLRAASSAFSLPKCPTWALTHLIVRLWQQSAARSNRSRVSCTNLDLTHTFLSAKRHAWLSLLMVIGILGVTHCVVPTEPFNIRVADIFTAKTSL